MGVGGVVSEEARKDLDRVGKEDLRRVFRYQSHGRSKPLSVIARLWPYKCVKPLPLPCVAQVDRLKVHPHSGRERWDGAAQQGLRLLIGRYGNPHRRGLRSDLTLGELEPVSIEGKQKSCAGPEFDQPYRSRRSGLNVV